MSKKDYVAIAGVIAIEYEFAKLDHDADLAITRIVNGIGDYFARDNSSFDRTRFARACGIIS